MDIDVPWGVGIHFVHFLLTFDFCDEGHSGKRRNKFLEIRPALRRKGPTVVSNSILLLIRRGFRSEKGQV